MERPILLHATTGLHQGGAERVLAMLATDPGMARFDHVVYSLLEGGAIVRELESAGVPVLSAQMKPSGAGLINVLPLIRAARTLQPALIQGWMYHGNLLACTLGAFTNAPVIWGIHHTTLAPKPTLKARMTLALSTMMSRVSPKSIVYCSQSAQQAHASRKFRNCGLVIPNGIDTHRYRPRPGSKAAIRAALNLPRDAFVVGTVGRFADQKDYLTLLRAARERCSSSVGRVLFALCGKDLCWQNATLSEWIRKMHLSENVVLLGPRDDIPDVLQAYDLFTLTSQHGEALPLALLEAMACGVPSVATDVGDCASVVGNPDWIAPPRNPSCLCDVWRRIESLDEHARREIGSDMRQRVIQYWGRERMIEQYRTLYESLIQRDDTRQRHGASICERAIQ